MTSDQEPLTSTLLPLPVRIALIRASKIVDGMERHRAIEKITEAAQARYPELFKVPP